MKKLLGLVAFFLNNSGNTQTWNATDGTAHIKGASSATISSGTAQKYVWDASTSLWWKN